MGRILMGEAADSIFQLNNGEAVLEAATRLGATERLLREHWQTLHDARLPYPGTAALLDPQQRQVFVERFNAVDEILTQGETSALRRKVPDLFGDRAMKAERERLAEALELDHAAQWARWGEHAMQRFNYDLRYELARMPEAERITPERAMNAYSENRRPLRRYFEVTEASLIEASNRPLPQPTTQTYAPKPVNYPYMQTQAPRPVGELVPRRIFATNSPYDISIEVDPNIGFPVLEAPRNIELHRTRRGFEVTHNRSVPPGDYGPNPKIRVRVPPSVKAAVIENPARAASIRGVDDARVSSRSRGIVTIDGANSYALVEAHGSTVVYRGFVREADFDGSNSKVRFEDVTSLFPPEIRNPGPRGSIEGTCRHLETMGKFDLHHQTIPPQPQYTTGRHLRIA